MRKCRKDLTLGSCAEGFGTLFARADAAEMVVGIDARRVAVVKRDLNGIVAYLRGSFGAGLGLEHGQHGRGGHSRRERLKRLFFPPFVIASRTGTLDRKSTRLNSSHGYISYAVFCLKKKKKT